MINYNNHSENAKGNFFLFYHFTYFSDSFLCYTLFFTLKKYAFVLFIYEPASFFVIFIIFFFLYIKPAVVASGERGGGRGNIGIGE